LLHYSIAWYLLVTFFKMLLIIYDEYGETSNFVTKEKNNKRKKSKDKKKKKRKEFLEKVFLR